MRYVFNGHDSTYLNYAKIDSTLIRMKAEMRVGHKFPMQRKVRI